MMQKYAKSTNIPQFPHGKVLKIYAASRGENEKFHKLNSNEKCFSYFEVSGIFRMWIVESEKTLANKSQNFIDS